VSSAAPGRVAILVASRNRKDLVDRFGEWAARNVEVPHDLWVVECGSEAAQQSRYSTLAYDDPDFLGKCFGHNALLRQARASGRYDWWWVVMNDLVFDEGRDPLQPLIEAMERSPRLALVSPTEVASHYPQAQQQAGGGVRPVTTVDYLGFLMRDAALQEVGFLNPAFRYCWGAIHELSFQLHRKGWWLAYSDAVSYRHLGGSTYGAKNTQTISRPEYQRRARRFAWRYFHEVYGADWQRLFWEAAKPYGASFDSYAHHRDYWATAFSAAELAALEQAHAQSAELASGSTRTGGAVIAAPPRLGLALNPCALDRHTRLLSRVTLRDLRSNGRSTRADVERLFASGRPRRLMLGCGQRPDPQAINVDVDLTAQADLFLDASDLAPVPDGSIDEIRSYHLFEHLTREEARRALREWHRVLRAGGELRIECPNLAVCAKEIGRHFDPEGEDLAMIGIYGEAKRAAELPMRHQWGWTPETLAAELAAVGFARSALHPVDQTWRRATKFGRDMQVRATR
jgi:SAM-dependent methyltransferase